VAGAGDVEVRVANTRWPRDCFNVMLLLAACRNVQLLEVDLALTANELGYFLLSNRASFSRLRIRRLVICEDFGSIEGVEGLRALSYLGRITSAPAGPRYSFMRCNTLVLQGYNFRGAEVLGGVDLFNVLRIVLTGAFFAEVQSLELKDILFEWGAPNTPYYPGAWLRHLIICPASSLRSLSISSNDNLVYNDHLIRSLCECMTDTAVQLTEFKFFGANMRVAVAEMLLRMLLIQTTLVKVTLSFDDLFSTQLEGAPLSTAYVVLLELISANKPMLKVINLRWLNLQFNHLTDINTALRKNTVLEHVYVPFDFTELMEAIACDRDTCHDGSTDAYVRLWHFFDHLPLDPRLRSYEDAE